MRMRFGIVVSLFVVVVALAACTGPAALGALPTDAPVAANTAEPNPRGTRPANFTPGGQRPPGAQRTPAAAATNAPSTVNTRVAPTAVAAGGVTNTNSIAPTAVPIPVVIIPTAVPSAPTTGSASTPATDATRTPITLPTVPALPTAVAPSNVAALRGKIIFASDRSNGYPQLYAMDADGANQHVCNCSDVLQTIVARERTSPDKGQFLFMKVLGGGLRNQGDQQIWAHHNEDGFEAVVTGAAPGFPTLDYDPVWSPNAKHIAWVSQTNGFDEIYLYDSSTGENVRLTQSSAEWYKHPSFSPDGSQLAYWTNKERAEVKQIWIMDVDGSDAHNISQSGYNDWDPIWVKQ